MLRPFEACNGCSFYFISSLLKNVLIGTVFVSYYLTLSQPMVLSLPIFSFLFLIDMFFLLKRRTVHQVHKKLGVGAESKV